MRPRMPMIAAALTALAVSPLPGQGAGTVEIGGFARYTRFDRTLGLDDAIGGGGWLGVFFAPGLALEGTGGYLSTSGPFATDRSLIPLHARLVLRRRCGLARLVGPFIFAHSRGPPWSWRPSGSGWRTIRSGYKAGRL